MHGVSEHGQERNRAEIARLRMAALPRGRLVGGCSSTNATAALRGAAVDYDAWGAAGLEGWSFEEVLPFFVRLESDEDFGSDPWHGARGPIPIRRYGPEGAAVRTEGRLQERRSHRARRSGQRSLGNLLVLQQQRERAISLSGGGSTLAATSKLASSTSSCPDLSGRFGRSTGRRAFGATVGQLNSSVQQVC